MGPRPRSILHLTASMGLASWLCGCGVRPGAPEWIGPDAAVVRCTVAGPNLGFPQLFDEVPTPTIPTGLFARTMDPIALDQLGYERDRVVCATLQAPTASELDVAEAEIEKLRNARNELSKQARKLGRCVCTHADALDARDLIPTCVSQPTRSECEADPDAVAALAELLAPLQAKLETTQVPRIHWRLFGRTDRLGRFVARHEDLLGRHLGGSEVYLETTPLPPTPGMALVSGLLAMEHVVGVVRQDGGRGLLVVREIGKQLVLDHFAYPDFADVGAHDIDASLAALLPHLDDAQLSRYRTALEPPALAREPMLRPRDGYMVELDRAGLERVDRATLVAARFVGQPYDEAAETRVLPPLLIDRFAHQVVYGTEGKVLRVRARLTEQGRQWLAGAADIAAFEALGGLTQGDLTPSFVPADARVAELFLLRGQPTEQLLFGGVMAVPAILMAVESSAGGSVDGQLDDFSVDLPSGPLPGEFETREGAAELRERLSLSAHELSVELVEGGQQIALELAPR